MDAHEIFNNLDDAITAYSRRPTTRLESFLAAIEEGNAFGMQTSCAAVACRRARMVKAEKAYHAAAAEAAAALASLWGDNSFNAVNAIHSAVYTYSRRKLEQLEADAQAVD